VAIQFFEQHGHFFFGLFVAVGAGGFLDGYRGQALLPQVSPLLTNAMNNTDPLWEQGLPAMRPFLSVRSGSEEAQPHMEQLLDVANYAVAP